MLILLYYNYHQPPSPNFYIGKTFIMERNNFWKLIDFNIADDEKFYYKEEKLYKRIDLIIINIFQIRIN